MHLENRSGLQAIALSVISGAIAGAAIAICSGRSARVPVSFESEVDATAEVRNLDASASENDPTGDGAIELLSSKLLRKRIIDVFPDGYLAVIAIIQGAAFGLLFVVVQQQLSHHPNGPQVALILAQALYEVAAIVVVTHLYLLLTSMLRWTPRLLDTLIPYLVGSGELLLALTTGENSRWWLSMSAFSLAGGLAFWNTRSRMTPGIFGLQKMAVYERQRRALKAQIIYCSSMLTGSFAVAMLNLYGICPSLLNIGLVCGMVISGIAIGLFGERAQNRIYRAYGIPMRKSLRQGTLIRWRLGRAIELFRPRRTE
jgi:hypothetical protein